MLKRTRGYILLTLLVLTGFAGRESNQTITSKERTLLVNGLKQSKKDLLASVEDLTAAQLAFKSTKTGTSIGEKLVLLAAAQADVLEKVELATKGNWRCHNTDKPIPGVNEKITAIALDSFMDELKTSQSRLVKYAKTTTEDLHGHPVELAGNSIDTYDALLTLPALTQACLSQIQEQKKHPGFPK